MNTAVNNEINTIRRQNHFQIDISNRPVRRVTAYGIVSSLIGHRTRQQSTAPHGTHQTQGVHSDEDVDLTETETLSGWTIYERGSRRVSLMINTRQVCRVFSGRPEHEMTLLLQLSGHPQRLYGNGESHEYPRMLIFVMSVDERLSR